MLSKHMSEPFLVLLSRIWKESLLSWRWVLMAWNIEKFAAMTTYMNAGTLTLIHFSVIYSHFPGCAQLRSHGLLASDMRWVNRWQYPIKPHTLNLLVVVSHLRVAWGQTSGVHKNEQYDIVQIPLHWYDGSWEDNQISPQRKSEKAWGPSCASWQGNFRWGSREQVRAQYPEGASARGSVRDRVPQRYKPWARDYRRRTCVNTGSRWHKGWHRLAERVKKSSVQRKVDLRP